MSTLSPDTTTTLQLAQEPKLAPRSVARRFFTHPGGIIPFAILVIIVAASVAAPLIQIHDPAAIDFADTFGMPSGNHILGGDNVGRDIWSRLVWGGQQAFLGCLLIIVVAVVLGVPSGLAAGYLSGWTDSASSWVSDVLMSVPAMIVLLIVAGGTNGNFVILMVVLGVFMAPGYYRLTRAATSSVRAEPYVDAAKVSGLGTMRIVGSHILRAISAPIIIQTSLTAGIALGMQAGLQFLGIGNTLTPSWGGMMSNAMQNIQQDQWLMVPPAVALGLVIASFAVMGSTLGEITGSRNEKAIRLSPSQRRRLVAAAVERARNAETPDSSIAVRITGLKVSYAMAKRNIEVVHGVDLEARNGEVLGIVGESGSGKSQTVFALVGLLPANGMAVADGLWVSGKNLTGLPPARRQGLLGTEIGYIPQEPISNLDPSFTIGHQLLEPMRHVLKKSRAEAHAEAIRLLTRVGIIDPERVMKLYPHQVSGGMAQRVLIAGAIAGRPKLLVADEPTTALDVTVQAEVLELLRELQAEYQMTLIIVTHNFGVVADLCDRVTVMKDGRIVESGDVETIFTSPTDPYTRQLINASLDGAQPRVYLDASLANEGARS